MRRLRAAADTLGGRIAALLAAGMVIAVTGSLLAVEHARRGYFDGLQRGRAIASAADIVDRLQRDPDPTIAALAGDRIIGANLIAGPAAAPVPAPDAAMGRDLAARIGPAAAATLAHADARLCAAGDPFRARSRTAGFGRPALPDCWLLSTRAAGRTLRIGLDLPRLPPPPSTAGDPIFLVTVATTLIVLSLLAARLALLPLRRLSAASRAFAQSIDADPVAETGPADVREALATFNLMQARVRAGVRERTRLLAAISHDLQTPLTRLRLRLEQVADEPLRERLIADLSATLRMMRRGLDLARGGESVEDWTMLDLDSLLSSIADDAAEFGQPVAMTGGCGAKVRVRPDALSRCLGNLVDNAVKYGGSAALSCRRADGAVVVTVRDRGPGMPAALLARAFEPFLRGDSAGEGSGIGLAIARAQAAAIGGTLTLRNGDGGGLEASLSLPVAAPASS